MTDRTLRLPPIVLTELLSAPRAEKYLRPIMDELPVIPLLEGYWERAGDNRRLILSRGLKAKTADALVAQCCIDAGVPLIARDGDFRHFAEFCGLVLA